MATTSTVEQFEQILSQDPSSPVFIEFAKVLIDQGEHARAVDICEKGLAHHDNSVVGRVLCGKALIHLGRPAEAMAQFDKAVALDRDNARVYTLVAEVLLRKGLYRSAVPLLRKATALKPNDARVKSWFEQTQAALAGGPPPDLGEPEPEQAAAPAAARGGPGEDEETQLAGSPVAQNGSPSLGEGGESGAVTRTDQFPAYAGAALGGEPDGATQVVLSPTSEMRNAQRRTEAVEDPFAHVPKRTSSSDLLPGMTETFDTLQTQQAQTVAPAGKRNGTRPSPSPSAGHGSAARTEAELPVAPVSSEPTIIPAPELIKSAEPPTLANVPPPVTHGGQKRARSLLAEIPDFPAPPSSVEMPKVEVSNEATKAIAQEYERELRAKLAASAAKKSFLQRHGVKLAIATVVLVGLVVGALAFVQMRTRNRGQGLKEALAEARTEVARDGRAKAREALERALTMVDSSEEAWALSAYVAALDFADQGGKAEDRTRYQTAAGHAGVKESFGELLLAGEYHLAAAGEAKKTVGERILAAPLDGERYPLGKAAVNELAGRILLASGTEKDAEAALKRLDESFQAVPNTRALLALADYYRTHSDLSSALTTYAKAEELGPGHPDVVLGEAETKLALGQDVEPLLAKLNALPPVESLPAERGARRELVRGRVLASVGKYDEALKVLEQGAAKWPDRTFEFRLAHGDSARLAGRLDVAQESFETALKLKASDEDALEGLGRVLIARDREREALKRLEGNANARKVSLVRGIAFAKLNDWKRARTELGRTQVNGKFPLEAVLYLALADAAEGEGAKALDVLEKTLATAKRSRSDVRVALGQVYWQRGALDKAREQFEEAAKDRRDWEGKCALGRLLLSLNMPDKALEPLQQSVARNGSHLEARNALNSALLQTGHNEEALAQAKAFAAQNPSAATAYRDIAHALLLLGKPKEAEEAVVKAAKADGKDPSVARVEAAVFFARGNSKSAFRALERANSLDSSSSDTFCDIGLAFVRMGNAANAEKAFKAAVREEPNAFCGKVGAHYVKLPSGGKPAAKELAELAQNAVAPWDKAFASATLARVLLSTGQLKEARKAADDAVALAPYAGYAQLSLGLVAQKQKDEETAKAALAKAAEVDPTYAAARLANAELLARNAETEASALAEYEVFLRLGGNPQEKSRVERTVNSLKKKLASR